MIKLRHLCSILCAVGFTLLLAGCHAAVLDPKGPIALAERHMLFMALGLMLIVVLPVFIATALITRRYRASNTKAKYTPDWSHSITLEIVWWSVPLAIIVVLASLTWIAAHRLDPYKPIKSDIKPITIQAIALQWRWVFIYPEQQIATVNYMEFPANTPINFKITADAPMNSFQIPQLAGQIYAMPAMQTQLHLMANEVGNYSGRSVSFSGDGFSGMTFVAKATTQDDFNQWVQSVKSSPHQLTQEGYDELAKPNEDRSVILYSTVATDLFKNVIMKYITTAPSAQGSPMQMNSAP